MSNGHYSVNMQVDIPIPVIGENGNWYVGNEDTQVQAKGDQGDQGPQGVQGPKGETGDLNMESLFLRPDLWEPGEEYAFGRGLYGQRFTGIVTAEPNKPIGIMIHETTTLCLPVSIGGWFGYVNGNGEPRRMMVPSSITGYVGFVNIFQNGFYFETTCVHNRNKQPYDVWIKYTK